jgi:hypothetical protein
MSQRSRNGLWVLALGLLLTLMSTQAGNGRVEAAPSDPYANLVVSSVQLSGGAACISNVEWGGLNGGKPLFVEVRLTFNNGNNYQTSWAANADEIYKVKQNASSLSVDFGSAAAADRTTDHRVQVSFTDRSGVQIGPTYTADAACG